jgi:hypothetical protein
MTTTFPLKTGVQANHVYDNILVTQEPLRDGVSDPTSGIGVDSGVARFLSFPSTYEASLILKSAVDKPGGFSNETFIDLEFGGDEISVMEAVGDRLFVFSVAQLTVVNIAQDIEFVEAQFIGQGVSKARQVCRFDENIAWVNDTGVYIFTGEKNLSITDGKIRTVTWDGANSAIVYDARRRLLIVWAEANKQYYFSLVSQSWVGESAISSQIPITNGFTAYSHKTFYKIAGGGFKQIGGDSISADTANRDVELITGKISCGNIAQRKNFYILYITASKAENIDVYIMTDDSHTSWTKVTGSLSNDDATTNEVSLRASNSLLSTGAKGKWIKLKFQDNSTNARSSFKIGDISVVYKRRTIK